jgi:hypothetical protein
VMLQTVQTHVASVYFESCIFHWDVSSGFLNVSCNIKQMLQWFFRHQSNVYQHVFSICFFMLQILNFNVVDIVFRCCNGTYNLNSGYLLCCTVAVKFQQTVIDASDRS